MKPEDIRKFVIQEVGERGWLTVQQAAAERGFKGIKTEKSDKHWVEPLDSFWKHPVGNAPKYGGCNLLKRRITFPDGSESIDYKLGKYIAWPGDSRPFWVSLDEENELEWANPGSNCKVIAYKPVEELPEESW